jgi:endonuclease YncB( thermonuclease family)
VGAFSYVRHRTYANVRVKCARHNAKAKILAVIPYSVAFLLLVSLPVLATTVRTGKVGSMADGDTLTLLVGTRQLRIRLAEIDAPGRGQPYGTKAKQALSDLVFGKSARVVEVDRDRYSRTVGQLYVGNLDVNAELVRQGYAWVYRKYAKQQLLYDLEDEARAAKQGLWADRHPGVETSAMFSNFSNFAFSNACVCYLVSTSPSQTVPSFSATCFVRSRPNARSKPLRTPSTDCSSWWAAKPHQSHRSLRALSLVSALSAVIAIFTT